MESGSTKVYEPITVSISDTGSEIDYRNNLVLSENVLHFRKMPEKIFPADPSIPSTISTKKLPKWQRLLVNSIVTVLIGVIIYLVIRLDFFP